MDKDVINFKRYYDQKNQLILYDRHHDEYFYYPSGVVVRQENKDLIKGVHFV